MVGYYLKGWNSSTQIVEALPRQKIMVRLPLIIEIIDKSYPYNTDKIWIPMSAYYGKLLPINYG